MRFDESELSHLVELIGLGTFMAVIALVNFTFAANDGTLTTYLLQYLSPVAGSLMILMGTLTILMRKRWAEGAFWIGLGYLLAAVANAFIFGVGTTPLFILSALLFLWAAYLVYLLSMRGGPLSRA